jgi:hypothetical protein
MSKTNVFTLIATALLGVLLYVILQLAHDLKNAPVIEATQPLAGNHGISTYADLLGFLERKGIGSEHAIASSAGWFQDRGFPGSHSLLGIPGQNEWTEQYPDLDDAVLESLSAKGDMAATQTLASHRISIDPFAAMELYATAAAQGSTYAIIQIGSLRETFANMELDRYRADPVYLEKIGRLRGDDSNQTLQLEAFAYAMAAVRDGGPPVIDRDLLAWLQRMAETIPPSLRESACERSEQVFLEFSGARRTRNLAPITRDPPAIFISIPDLADLLPCRETSHPAASLLDLRNCEIYPIEMFMGSAMDLYSCENW